ncbi:pantoate--beta-alanine ligase [Neptuniibacter caesariensis]|uniref:Pantothenate synthetase n=1 Tax=Neptuniibacter caesariensis TaxID=207954 RepID=A0A7U8C4C4_NEPCE|nr:pantoate--beta-alanine ligase [Neptuniibacter caesariensis]EAR59870.1 pantoate--beta-alanine ligase [Oceanospirillum sp. MED92] [Neptuniibacter caesariensis]
MITIHTIAELRAALSKERFQGKRIGFVPTMGNLHEGHLQLIDQAKANSDIVVSSIFVNPLQFGANEDLDNYPRTLQDDQAKLESRGCDFLFAPTDAEVYPHGREAQTQVEVPVISDLYCGSSRPGHFRGVATVVTKLFGMVQPDVAIFGEKDFQQLMVIRRMTEDLSLPVEIQGAPIARNPQGLALSSRNGYLSAEEIEVAANLNRTLRDAAEQIKQGNKQFAELEEQAQSQLEEVGFKRDYYVICRRDDLQPANESDTALVILAAAYLGPARLIDNIQIDL